ncbi:hypothetical protein [Kitasatospora aureofaciens]|uniref:hypothetical protein n=1 Tax=Kitasatospora aureofaciens TaxID=1894 RepID=UPI0037C590CA
MSEIDRLLHGVLAADETPVAGRRLYTVLRARGITAIPEYTGGNFWVLTIPFGSGTIWASDLYSHIAKPFTEHPGWIANFYHRDDETREFPITVYELSDLAFAADTDACADAIAEWIAASPYPSTAARMPLNLSTQRNADSATRALARLEELELIPLHPYPGSDVHWDLTCGRTGCSWSGRLFYSHLRASRGHDRRHVGCTGTPSTCNPRLTDAELLQRLTTLFPNTAFTITTDQRGRAITWTDDPAERHLTALIGSSQGTLHRLSPSPDAQIP